MASMNAGSSDVEYADHEVQTIGVRHVLEGDETENNQELESVINVDPVSDRGLDNDELAQLIAMYRTATLSIGKEDVAQQTQVGVVDAEFGMGINIGLSEVPTRTLTNGEDVTNDSQVTIPDGQEAGTIALLTDDDPGVIDISRLRGSPGFTNSSAGGPSTATSTTERDLDFGSLFGSGPFVDATDDLSLFSEVDVTNLSGGVQATLEHNYVLYWSVEEMPEGRASFSRP